VVSLCIGKFRDLQEAPAINGKLSELRLKSGRRMVTKLTTVIPLLIEVALTVCDVSKLPPLKLTISVFCVCGFRLSIIVTKIRCHG